MSTKLTLVPLAPTHADVLAALHCEGFDQPWPPEAFTSLLANSNRIGALALADSKPAGFIMIQETPEEAEVLTFVVAHKYRRAGIGRALLDWAVDRARSAGCTRILLEVGESNEAARALYGKTGFHQIGARSGYYNRGQDVETALLLSLSVVSTSRNR